MSWNPILPPLPPRADGVKLAIRIHQRGGHPRASVTVAYEIATRYFSGVDSVACLEGSGEHAGQLTICTPEVASAMGAGNAQLMSFRQPSKGTRAALQVVFAAPPSMIQTVISARPVEFEAAPGRITITLSDDLLSSTAIVRPASVEPVAQLEQPIATPEAEEQPAAAVEPEPTAKPAQAPAAEPETVPTTEPAPVLTVERPAPPWGYADDVQTAPTAKPAHVAPSPKRVPPAKSKGRGLSPAETEALAFAKVGRGRPDEEVSAPRPTAWAKQDPAKFDHRSAARFLKEHGFKISPIPCSEYFEVDTRDLHRDEVVKLARAEWDKRHGASHAA